ncbi:hypothetical protein B0O80DRAFT_444993 [Mortierella sp. GBAus27b]|nr:hypothetical protein B0O80DRAFT_444993 [Mortierella sp. GBAus27b]
MTSDVNVLMADTVRQENVRPRRHPNATSTLLDLQDSNSSEIEHMCRYPRVKSFLRDM